jgi:hypothetical protein
MRYIDCEGFTREMEKDNKLGLMGGGCFGKEKNSFLHLDFFEHHPLNDDNSFCGFIFY